MSEYEYEEYSAYVTDEEDMEGGGVGGGVPLARSDETGDEDIEESLPAGLAPATIRIIKLLKEAEEEMNRGPTPEEIAWEEEIEADTSMWGYVRWSGWKTYKGAEWLGGKIAHATGITAPKFDYYIQHAIREREEEDRRRREEFEARTAVLQSVENGGGPVGGGGHSFVSSDDENRRSNSEDSHFAHSHIPSSVSESIAMSSHE